MAPVPFVAAGPDDVIRRPLNPFQGAARPVVAEQGTPEQALAALLKAEGLKMDDRIIESVSAAQAAALLDILRKDGAQVTQCKAGATQGYNITGHGIETYAEYDHSTSSLAVTVTKKPWWVPAGAIKSHLEAQLSQLPQAPGA